MRGTLQSLLIFPSQTKINMAAMDSCFGWLILLFDYLAMDWYLVRSIYVRSCIKFPCFFLILIKYIHYGQFLFLIGWNIKCFLFYYCLAKMEQYLTGSIYAWSFIKLINNHGHYKPLMFVSDWPNVR